MQKTIKCENCGASINTDTDNAMRFCPFCGTAFMIPETYADIVKFQARHNEEVRKQMYKEKQAEIKRNKKSDVILFIFIILLLVVIGSYLVRNDPDTKCEHLVESVQQLIVEENYDQALIEAQKIRVEKQGLFDSRYDRWENQRKDLIKLIEQKKKEAAD